MTELKITQADRDAVRAFHSAQLKRIFLGDKTLGENRDAIEQAFARHRIASQAELVEALADLCSWETELTQDKWDHARDVLARVREEG